MSYSFQVHGANKAEAKAQLAEKMEAVVAQQSCHAKDKVQVLAAAGAFIDLVDQPAGRDLVVSVSGYLSGQWSGTDVTAISGASFSCSVGLTPANA